MATLITVQGTQQPFVMPTTGTDRERLRVVQEAVGGYVQIVPAREDKVLICDEDGLLKKREPNALASQVAGRRIVGDAIVCDTEELAAWDA